MLQHLKICQPFYPYLLKRNLINMSSFRIVIWVLGTVYLVYDKLLNIYDYLKFSYWQICIHNKKK